MKFGTTFTIGTVAVLLSGCVQSVERSLPEPVVITEPATPVAPVPAPVDLTAGPPNAIPGQCYAQATRPARFDTVSRQVVDRPATETISVIPPTYRTETVPVVIEEAYTRVETIPAVYETVMETVVIEPARERTITVPAEFTTVTESVPVRPSYRSWVVTGRILATGTSSQGGTVIGNRTLSDGTIEALIEFPPEFETVTREELVRPETTRIETIPAVTREVPRRIVVEPARTVEVVVPAVTRDVERTVIATAERIERTPVPATFRTVEDQVEVLPASSEWVTVLCDTAQTATVVRALQRGLAERGYYNGAVDGIIGNRTMRAVRAYQLDLGYDTPAITLIGLQNLGIVS
ncbi:peptidoglycan-binding domain-containing protein [Pontivivens insulae]|uniref:Peptidoglycan binding-like domain-containing protein n=1 Tax=Pontivivens insulae TaxID=1639689 RepID=A0A2R8AB45_9RHOB|nr:peptidoglycan-binding domain-containing protein [Pontivivens insulae]RED13178.1 putative peptidoglycan binding protein [Pontivivens insulae]SPF29270.1 hypothetical protein POI8812_01577 [Pontivivens insulae]